MDRYLSLTEQWRPEIVGLIRHLVECESPSDDPAAVNRFVDLVADTVSGTAKVKTFPGGRFGKHLRCEFDLPGRRKRGRLLVLGHSDTVHPVGALASMPFREEKGRLWGPGVLDMKGGLAFLLFAMRALRELDTPVPQRVVLLLTSDEEVGSESSRPITEREAGRSGAVLVIEPGTGLEGKLKTARKGVGDYTVTVRGKAAHAGVDFASGANAVVELARQIEKITGFTRLKRGLTVSPGMVSGGVRNNVVPDLARLGVDVRVQHAADAAGLDRKFRSLRPVDRRCTIEVTGGLSRPPMERSAGAASMFRTARRIAAGMGIALDESLSGGGSDGNFTAALGVPTLDGLGAVGEGAHSSQESILTSRIADRTALLAQLIAAL